MADVVQTIVLLDFDGTITRHDTLWMFLRHACGGSRMRLMWRLFCRITAIVWAMCHGAGAVKEQVCMAVLSHLSSSDLDGLCSSFVPVVERDIRPSMIDVIVRHRNAGHRLYVVSASLLSWIEPWSRAHGFSSVIATRPKFDTHGHFSGFASPNCKGWEKVMRISAEIDLSSDTYKIGYGNSDSDLPMLDYCDESFLMRENNEIVRYR